MSAGSIVVWLLCFVVVSTNLANCLPGNEENATELPRKTFQEAEKEITEFVNDQLRSLLPRVVGGAGATTLSQRCQASMMKVLANVRQLKGWTLKLLDSMAKPSTGILQGTSYSLGQYDQCTNMAATKKGVETRNLSEAMFQGMYCKVKIRFDDAVVDGARKYHRGEINATELGKLKEIIQSSPPLPVTSEFMNHYLGICLPSTCTIEDVQELLGIISFPGITTLERCEIKNDDAMDNTQVIIMTACYLLIALVCVSSAIHWLFKRKIEDKLSRDDKCVSVSISFSMCNSTRYLMKNIEDDTDSILAKSCVRGIVVASTAWIILGQAYMLPHDSYYLQASCLNNLQSYFQDGYFALIVNFPLAVDALFTCYGFILTYNAWHAASRAEDVRVHFFRLIICNYIRICIPVLLALGVGAVLPMLGSGPFWQDFMNGTRERCSTSVWSHIGMYSNFLGYHEQCFSHLWYVSCFAQLTLLGIVLSYILSKTMRIGIILTILLVVAGNVTVGIYTFRDHLPPAYVPYFLENATDTFFNINYSLPLSHFGPYGVGLLAGIFVARRSGHKLSPLLAAVGWLFCLVVLCCLKLFLYKYNLEPMGVFLSSFYAGTHRTLYGLCIAWIIVACSFGNGGFVNAILSWRVFDPLFRLSYYAYIFHFIVIYFSAAVAKEHFHYSHYELVLRAISYIAVTFFLSYIFYILLEGPLKNFFSSLCKKRTSQLNLTSLNNGISTETDIFTPNSAISGSCKLWSVTTKKTVPP